jgi:hypothetical protein
MNYDTWVINTNEPPRRVNDTCIPQMDCITFARTRLGFEPDVTQARVLDHTIRRGILNCTRQWGKSTVMAIKALYQAYFFPGTLTLVLSPSERQSGMLVNKIRRMARKLGVETKKDGLNSVSMVFPNDSRIVGLPESEPKIRGFDDVRLMLVDEASRVDEELYDAVTPMLAVGDGSLWLISTPYGPRGFFYREWVGREDWVRIAVPATECPRLSRRFLEEERRRKGDRKFRQEFLCEFIDDSTRLFPRDVVERSKRKEISPILQDLSWVIRRKERERR